MAQPQGREKEGTRRLSARPIRSERSVSTEAAPPCLAGHQATHTWRQPEASCALPSRCQASHCPATKAPFGEQEGKGGRKSRDQHFVLKKSLHGSFKKLFKSLNQN